jgi:hypothetical protein
MASFAHANRVEQSTCPDKSADNQPVNKTMEPNDPIREKVAKALLSQRDAGKRKPNQSWCQCENRSS